MALPEIPRFNTPSGLPETIEEFEQLKAGQRAALRRYWQTQPESARKQVMARLFPRKPNTKPEPRLDVEVMPEVSEEDLERIKSEQRAKQERRWAQMSEEERNKLIKELLPTGEEDPRPFLGCEKM